MYLTYKKDCPTLILEDVASIELWIWDKIYDVVGSNNDINVLNQSPLFNEHLNNVSPVVIFRANDTLCQMGYYIATVFILVVFFCKDVVTLDK